MRNYPRDRCIAPPLKSELVDECGDRCSSTVTIINDMSSDMWGRSNLVNKLKETHRVLIFNNRGHYNVVRNGAGKPVREGDDGWALNVTDYMPDPARCKREHGIDPYNMDFLVDDTKRVMDEHGVKKSDVVGFSLGAFIAQSFAAKYPERVNKLVIGKGFTRYKDYIRVARNLVSGPLFQGAYWVWCNARPKFNTKERDYGCTLPLVILDDYARQILNMDLSTDQARIKARTMVIHCRDDDVLGEPVNQISNMKEITMNGCGHFFFAGNDKMYDEVTNFLKY